ncbi:MAG: RluA family pseudouridine synthase [Ruminococcus sp.]|nr:RluA family pseudouridine synthase [Ruminococcus sp.]
MAEKLTFIVTDEYNSTKAGRYLRTVARLSARTLAILKRTEGGLTVNGKLLRTIDTVYAGDVIEMNLPSENSETITPVQGELDILYEDEYILIVNKPAFMPVHPTKVHQTDTLANIVSYKYKDIGYDFVFRAVNRLDANTTGAVVIAKDRHTASLMQSTDITKHYIAICHGNIREKGTINAPIALRTDSKIVRCVSTYGQCAITHYDILSELFDATVLDVVIETGRTHQIRCHMSHIGHPLLGDDLYGGSKKLINRHALHCKTITFLHPFSNKEVFVDAPVPEDMNTLISKLSVG